MELAESGTVKRIIVLVPVLLILSFALDWAAVCWGFGFAFGFVVNGKFVIWGITSYAIFTEFVATMLLAKVFLKMRMPWLAVASIAALFIVLGFEFFNPSLVLAWWHAAFG